MKNDVDTTLKSTITIAGSVTDQEKLIKRFFLDMKLLRTDGSSIADTLKEENIDIH